MSAKKPGKKTKKGSSGASNASKVIDFPGAFSFEGLFTGIGRARTRRSALDEAQKIMYAAWEAPSRRRAVELAKKALSISADCADACVFLAEVAAGTPQEAIELYRQGVAAGERALGRKAFKEDAGHFWGLLETRPYMRARAGLAECLWETGKREEAVAHYWDLLRLNPNDNQGIRDLLMPCLIELNRDGDAERLHQQYEHDILAIWFYSRALLDFRRHGAGPQADRSLKAACEKNPYVARYLLGRTKLPRRLPDSFRIGGKDEAVMCASGSLGAWNSTPGALEWLAAGLKMGRIRRSP